MEFTKKFREKGIKVTPQRIAVYQALSELGHASVEEIAASVSAKNPAITIATVYNVLDCFAEHDIVSRLNTPMGRKYYDISTHRHHHIIGKNGKILDYESKELYELIDNYFIQNPIKDFEIKEISLQIIGN